MRAVATCGMLLAILGLPARADETAASKDTAADASLDDQLDAAEADGIEPRRQLVAWNHYEGPYFTLRVGAGFGYDFAAYAQDANSKQQMTLSPEAAVRDFRLLLKGRFPKIPRLSYSFGYMYDGAAKAWRVRQSGLKIDVPELLGGFFIGRTKEGFSTNKIMVGYFTWTGERATMNEALIPILADGVKWSGTIPSGKLVYNDFFDEYSQTESFNKNDSQFVARAVWLPNMGSDKPLLHPAVEARFAEANNGFGRGAQQISEGSKWSRRCGSERLRSAQRHPGSTNVFLGAVIRTSPIGELTDGQESAIHMNIQRYA